MKIYYEWGIQQINKKGEELCGDSISVHRDSDSITIALSDGLGSGVIANILATLTTQIAIKLLENYLPLEEVVQTLSETLPVSNVRKLAYSTFTIGRFKSNGFARVVDFDSPSVIHIRSRKFQPIIYRERDVEKKQIHECELDLKFGDWVVFVSDGVLNAGIGGVYPLGWGWDQAAHFIEERARPDISAQDLADKIASAVKELYAGRIGDDVSIIAIKARKKLTATVLTGPPVNNEQDEALVREFISRPGIHIVCGGTTAKIVSRHLGQPLDVDLRTMTEEVPPIASIKGIDLVSEGILTLTKVSDLLRSGVQRKMVRFQMNGAANLLRYLLEVDHVHFLVGQAVNPAHQNPELPKQLEIRLSVVREIADELRKRNKEATIEMI